MKKKGKTPSRIKYEREHPTVSFRVSKELFDRLEAVKKAEGKSNTDVLKAGVGLLEVKVREEEEVRLEGYKDGYDKGYREAKARYQVTYQCKVCRERITVDSLREREAVKRYMREHGWGHADCVNR